MLCTKPEDLLMKDIANPEQLVEVEVSSDNTKLWVNVDGICVLRIQNIPSIEMNFNKRSH